MNPDSRNPISFLQLIRRSERGKLKVYLGHAPGVGKTYQMLQEGHRLKAEGIDVAVGLVETHGRKDIELLLDGLEVVPRQSISYRGITLEEMDLDALLARKPQVALVDELAHTNPPGSRNAKRYMDVQDLLAAGIHVITTMNVQHLESLYNTVESLVQVKVMERLPDAVLMEADEIVNVDLSPEDLQKRLKAGKIYPLDRVPQALENYFQPRHLEQLRELALREAASQIDFRRREHEPERDEIVPDQIMVCLSSSGANNAHLLRYASRLAGQLNRKWYAVYVQTPAEDPTTIDATVQRSLSDVLTLANQLGAMVFTFRGQDVVDTILRFAREYRVGRIVLGRSRPLPIWKRILGHQTLVARLLEKSAGTSVTVVGSGGSGLELGEIGQENDVPQSGAAKISGLSRVLKPSSIVIWNESVSRDQVIHDLAAVVNRTHSKLSAADVASALLNRESEISTFLNEGIGVPHACVDSLSELVVAFGVTKAGVKDVPTEHPIEAIFMALYPPHLSTEYLRLMSATMSAFRNRQVLRGLAAANSPKEVLAVLRAQDRSRS
jgi:two-component system, OmpR family, sensor histidine kinase KdpD